MTQKDRILQVLRQNKRVSNFELHAMQPAIYQIPTRIKELKEEGHPIIGYHDKDDRRKYWYEYIQVQKDLFAA